MAILVNTLDLNIHTVAKINIVCFCLHEAREHLLKKEVLNPSSIHE